MFMYCVDYYDKYLTYGYWPSTVNVCFWELQYVQLDITDIPLTWLCRLYKGRKHPVKFEDESFDTVS